MSIHRELTERMMSLRDGKQAEILMRFFKTGKGEYGEGDRFLGLKVPQTRAVVKDFRHEAGLRDVEVLTASPWHEVRLAGFLLLIEIFKRRRKDEAGRREAVDFYLSILERGNNWDLVDLVAPKLLGEWLIDHPADRCLLDELAAMDGRLWHQRVAIVTTWTLLREGIFADTIRISEKLLTHPHDLIHKATGWMLREMGKRGGMARLRDFLTAHSHEMPRTMLRYSIEKLSPAERLHWLTTRKDMNMPLPGEE